MCQWDKKDLKDKISLKSVLSVRNNTHDTIDTISALIKTRTECINTDAQAKISFIPADTEGNTPRRDKDKYVRLNPGYFQQSSEKIKHVWKWSGETKTDHNIHRERTAPLADVREIVRGCRESDGGEGGSRQKWLFSPCSNSASHTSLQLGTLPLLINKS